LEVIDVSKVTLLDLIYDCLTVKKNEKDDGGKIHKNTARQRIYRYTLNVAVVLMMGCWSWREFFLAPRWAGAPAGVPKPKF
jgi:hypothetical protein